MGLDWAVLLPSQSDTNTYLMKSYQQEKQNIETANCDIRQQINIDKLIDLRTSQGAKQNDYKLLDRDAELAHFSSL